MLIDKLLLLLQKKRAPSYLSNRFQSLDNNDEEILRGLLRKEYFPNLTYSSGLSPEQYLSTEEGKQDMEDHISRRLALFRKSIIPWLDSIKPLATAKILEIGCGTGCSTIALAEQGAIVTGIDIDKPSLIVAENRISFYGLTANIINENAINIDRFKGMPFDYIIFFATLEHMTVEERILSLKKAWDLLPKKGVLVVIDTPNRLWYFDDHSSMLPFFHWLPDQLALEYSSKSPRENFYRFPKKTNSVVPTKFYRLGRGVSYHEFELALEMPAELLKVVGEMRSYLQKKELNPLVFLRGKNSIQNKYSEILNRLHPEMDAAFFKPYLNLAILKNN